MVAFNFDATDVNNCDSPDPLPEGRYRVKIIETEMKPMRSGQGRYLQLALQVVDGPRAQHILWDRISVESRSQTVARIAKAELAAICRAVNRLKLQETSDLIGAQAFAYVCCKTDRYTGEKVNYVRAYEPRR
jgi:hypothetical protein